MIDTGVTVSSIPENGNKLFNHPRKFSSTSLNVTSGDDSKAYVDKKVTLPIKPKGSSQYQVVPFYVQNTSRNILGYDALLGLDHLKRFRLSLYVVNRRFRIYCDNIVIGEQTEVHLEYKALVRVDTRFDDLNINNSIKSLIKRFESVFTDITSEAIRGTPMRILTTHTRPIYAKQRNYTPEEAPEMKEHINGLLAKVILHTAGGRICKMHWHL